MMNTDFGSYESPYALPSLANGSHSRKASIESAGSFGLPSSVHNPSPHDSHSLHIGALDGLTESSKLSQSGFGAGGRHHETGIRRARHEATFNPYGSVHRHNSFSGSEGGHRSSSSEAEELATANGGAYGFNPSASHPDLLYGNPSGLSSLYGRTIPQGPPVASFHGQHSLGAPNGGLYGGGQTSQSLDECAAAVRQATTTSASDRAKHIFVQAWLTSTYAPWQDGNVPRQGLYDSYRQVCNQYEVPHVNTATLGKAIRLCFPNIKTRRLGVRGNSKYHYCGIRPGTAEEAQFLQDFVERTNNLRPRTASISGRSSQDEDTGEDEDEEADDSLGLSESRNRPMPLRPNANGTGGSGHGSFLIDDKTPTVGGGFGAAQAQYGPRGENGVSGLPAAAKVVASNASGPEPYRASGGALAVGASVKTLPGFPSIEDAVGSPDSDSQFSRTAREVWTWYIEFLDSLADSIRQFRIDLFESSTVSFWMGLKPEQKDIVQAPSMAGSMARAECLVYDEFLEIFRSAVLTAIPTSTLTAIRQLSEKIERLLLESLREFLPTFYTPKVELAARFAHLTLRFLDIHQVTQALASVLAQRDQLIDMARSWREIDFDSVRNQVALVCNCHHEHLQQILQVEFVQVLEGLPRSAEPVKDIMTWSDRCCAKLLGGQREGVPLGPNAEPPLSSRSLLIRWGYVTSQIMRDLTIRSDPAFGAFQILKLFMDDWVGFNVMRTVALSNASVTAATVAEPQIQHDFLALSPGGTTFSSVPHNSLGAATMMATTPTTANLLAAMSGADPYGSGVHGGPGAHSFGFDSYADLDGTSGVSGFEFDSRHSLSVSEAAHTPSTVGTGVGADTEMSPSALSDPSSPVKTEPSPP